MLNVIVNPHVRKMDRLVAELAQRLTARAVPYRIFYPGKAGDAREYAKCLTEAGETQIVAVGGDGTLNEVLCGLRDPSRVELGLIPAGTGNDFAAAAGIPHGAAALELILNGEAKPTDYIECGGRRSMNIAGMGIDVEILRRCAAMKHGTSRSKYFFSLVATLLRYRGRRIAVTADGTTREYEALIAAVCNGSQLGGGIPLCPAAKIDDGLLELVVVDCPPRIKLLPELVRLMRGKLLERPITHRVSCKAVKIEAVDGAGAVQYDGEIFADSVLDARVVSGGLRMFRS